MPPSDTAHLLDESIHTTRRAYGSVPMWGRKTTTRLLRKIKEKMDARSAIADTMLMAMSTAMQAVPRRASRRLSDFSDIAHLTVSFNGIQLNAKQHKLIKSGFDKWRRKASQSAGEWVHDYVGSKNVALKQLFDAEPDIKRRHAEAITRILEMTVESVENLDDALGPLLVSYACEDGVLEEKGGFDRAYWSRISEGLCQLARNFPVKSNKYDTINAWRIVVLFICNKIEYGFELARKPSTSSNASDRTSDGGSLHDHDSIGGQSTTVSFDNPCYGKA